MTASSMTPLYNALYNVQLNLETYYRLTDLDRHTLSVAMQQYYLNDAERQLLYEIFDFLETELKSEFPQEQNLSFIEAQEKRLLVC